MSKSNNSNYLDRSESLPASRFSSLFHTNVTSVEMRGLQSSVRKQRELGEKNKIGYYDIGTKDEDSSSEHKKADIERRVLEDRNSRVFDIETEDEGSIMRNKDKVEKKSSNESMENTDKK